MKLLATYLVMLTLFITGTRLVTAQQKYTRSIQTLAPVAPEKIPFQQYVQLASHSVKETYHDFRPTTDAGVVDTLSDERSKSVDVKIAGTRKAVAKRRQSIKR